MPETGPLPGAPRVNSRAVEILEASGIHHNPFFRALHSGEMDRGMFLGTQRQFYFAVLEFPRAMLSLLARIPLPAQRLGILENVVEEHGQFHADAFHETTFRRFLALLGAVPFDPEQVVREPAVESFYLTLMGACQFETVEFGTACLGIIELAFADISAAIGRTVVERGWVAAHDLVHYNLHAEIDKHHAAEMFATLEPIWCEPAHHAEIERGLQLGAYAFDRLYRDLW